MGILFYKDPLFTHLIDDDDPERRTQAEVLLNAYNRELERRRLAAGAQGLLISGDGWYSLSILSISNLPQV